MVEYVGSSWERLLNQEGLGPYRGAPGKRIRRFYPEEEFPWQVPEPRRHLQVDWSRLSAREKEVILRLYYDCQSEREVAQALALSRGSVRVYRNRALHKLKGEGGISKA
ncbi:MAG TPA: sigma factor-like helix-turn-helix DNA-binding protein [Atribacteraceae bacterium]|nr:sigma factor-like helix-turn-helix DNA-binding protein [Atribacteraceae bacterium]